MTSSLLDETFAQMSKRRQQVTAAVELGESEGHPFRGNQHTGGIPGDGAWRPVMSGKDAEAFAKGSAWPLPCSHATTPRNAQAIREHGFKPGYSGVWGPGVYLGVDQETTRLYHGWKGTEILTVRANVKNPLTVKLDSQRSSSEQIAVALGEIHGHSEVEQKVRDIANEAARDRSELLGIYQERYDAKFGDRIATLGERNALRKDLGEEFMTRFDRAAALDGSRAAQLNEAARQYGYDSIAILGSWDAGPGGQQLLVFDPKNIVVDNNNPELPEFLKETPSGEPLFPFHPWKDTFSHG